MNKRNYILPIIINTAIFIFLEIAALNMLANNSVLQNIWLSNTAHKFMAKTWGYSESMKDYFSLPKENEELAKENFKLRRKIAAYENLMNENYAKIAASKIETKQGYEYIPAEIVKISRNKQHNYIIVNKGSEDGVTNKSGLITNKGVIGIVDAVDKHYSYAISFMNTQSSISSRLHKEGPVGPLIWDGQSSSSAILKEIPLQSRFAPGDTVYTSGYSSIFPPDIPLGITGKSKIVNGSTYEINISLFQDFKRLKFVTIVQNMEKETIENLSKKHE